MKREGEKEDEKAVAAVVDVMCEGLWSERLRRTAFDQPVASVYIDPSFYGRLSYIASPRGLHVLSARLRALTRILDQRARLKHTDDHRHLTGQSLSLIVYQTLNCVS